MLCALSFVSFKHACSHVVSHIHCEDCCGVYEMVRLFVCYLLVFIVIFLIACCNFIVEELQILNNLLAIAIRTPLPVTECLAFIVCLSMFVFGLGSVFLAMEISLYYD